MTAALIERAWFTWQGRRFEALRSADGTWLVACPLCGDGAISSRDGSPHDETWLAHAVTVAADGAMTVSPSVVCPRKGCTWHVVITNGVAS